MNVLIYGKRRQGKSTLALALSLAFSRKVLIFDPNDQYPRIVRVNPDEWFSQIKEEEEDGEHRIHLGRVGPFDSDEIEERFSEFSESVYSVPDISVIADEAHMLQGQNWIHPDVDRFNRRSPKSVVFLQTTHRIVNAHPDSRYHADHVFFFRADLPREIKTIGENFGPEVASVVPILGPHEALHFWREKGGIARYSTWDKPVEWYIDLGNQNA